MGGGGGGGAADFLKPSLLKLDELSLRDTKLVEKLLSRRDLETGLSEQKTKA